jgi:hypothetical protein
MNTLVLKDLPRLAELDRAASQSVRGGYSCLTREIPPWCRGGLEPIEPVRGGCEYPPLHYGCGPVTPPCGELHREQPLKVIPL